MNLFSKVLAWFMAVSTWIKAITWLAASQIIYFVMLLVTIPSVEKQANGMKILDLMTFGYSPQYLTSFMETLGKQGRDIYLMNQIPLDMIYPGLMAVSGAMFIALLAKKVNRRLGILMFIPLFSALFDYLENGMITTMLLAFPRVQQPIIFMSSAFTITKTMLTTLYLVILVVLFILFLFKIVRAKRI